MDESEVIVQAACSVSLSTEGSIIPFTPGDVYLCAGDRDKGESGELWCLVVLHKRNFPRKYSIARQLTKITVRKRGAAIGFIVIEFDDTNQVRLKDFSTDAAYIAQVLEFCFTNRTHPSLVDLLRAGDLTTPLPPIIELPQPLSDDISNDSNEAQSFRSSPSSSKNSSFEMKLEDDRLSEYNERKRLSRTKRSVDSGCITPPVRCIASIEETRVINEATVENIPEREPAVQQSNCNKFSYNNQYHQGQMSNHKYVYQHNRFAPGNGYLSMNGEGHNTPVSLTPPLQSGDIFTNISSPPNGSTPPREFFVSVLDPNNCQADITVEATDSPDKSYHSEENLKDRKVAQRNLTNDLLQSPPAPVPPHTPASLRTTPPPPSPPPHPSSPHVPHQVPSSPPPSHFSPPHTSPSQDSSDKGPVRRSKRRLTSSALKYTDDGGLLPLTQREKERRRIVSEGTTPKIPCIRNKLSNVTRKHSRLKSTSSSLDNQESQEIPPMKTENLSIQQDFLNDFNSLISSSNMNSINGGESTQIDPDTFINSLSPKSCKSEPDFNGSEFLASVLSNEVKSDEGNEVKGGEDSTPSLRRSLRPRSEPLLPTFKKEDTVTCTESTQEDLGNYLGNPTPHGFVNLGNTCYMNCVLQCVLTVPSFTAVLYAPNPPVTPTLYNCLATLLQCKLRSGGPEEKKKLLVKVKSIIAEATNLFKGSRQQDAHEFLGKFLDVLREERQNSLKCPVARSFQCEVVHTIRCSSCRGGGQKVEQYYDFSLNLPPKTHQPHNLANLLDSYFATDLVEYVCGVCGHGTAQVQHRFSQLPEALVLHVQRYAFSRGGSREGKRQDSIDIPTKLDITRLSWDSKDTHIGPRVITPDPSTPPPTHGGRMLRARNKAMYSLHAIISHLGESRECGHYICDVRDGDKWLFFDDVNMHKVDSHYVREKRKNSCYIFFYLRDDSNL